MDDIRDVVTIAAAIKDAARRRLFAAEKALIAFRDNDLELALTLLDLCCNERVPAAEDLLFRAEVLARKGALAAAADDSALAFDINPSLPAIQLKHLEAVSSSREQGRSVARGLLRHDVRQDVLLRCASVLLSEPSTRGVGVLRPDGVNIHVELYAKNNLPIELTFHFDRGSQQVILKPQERLSSAGNPIIHGRISLAWPPGATVLAVETPADIHLGRASLSRPAPANGVTHSQDREASRGVLGAQPSLITIIVPVFAGLDETIATLASVIKNTDWSRARVILVDDRGPDQALGRVLTAFANHPAVTVLRNPTNLGFIGSINRALATVPDGDVVLLNADTEVGPQWLERLSAAAHSSDGIGTVTPLSNNGELTSVPRPFQSSAMPQTVDIEAINGYLAARNDGRVVEVPNGVGFCLYITAACRQDVGFLDEHDFVDGYLEEVDYCLRATAKGFRHLCALDTFVAHKGGTSFRDRRRSLVVQNLKRLERKFPDIRRLTHLFMNAGLLDDVVRDVQVAFLANKATTRLPVHLEIGSDLARLRDHQGSDPDVPVISMTFEGGNREILRLKSADLFSPADLREVLPEQNPHLAISALLQRFSPERVVLDLSDHPDWIRDLLSALSAPVELAMTRGIGHRVEIERILKQVEFRRRPVKIKAWSRLTVKELRQHGINVTEVPVAAIAGRKPNSPIGPDQREVIAVFVEEEGRWSDRALEKLAINLLQHREPPDLIVMGEPSHPHRLERLGIVRRLMRPAPSTIADALQARHAGLSLHLADPQHAVSRWSEELMAAGLPILTTSPYIAAASQFGDAEHVPIDRLAERLMHRIGQNR